MVVQLYRQSSSAVAAALTLLIVFLCTPSFIYSQYAEAQTITLTAPAVAQSVKEGDDFATTQLQNAWDFDQTRDIGFEINFNTPNISNSGGVWRGVSSGQGGYVFPLFGGYPGVLAAEGLPGDKDLPRFGIKHPIAASKYRELSFRMRHSSRSTLAIYWDADTAATYFPDGSNAGISADAYSFSGQVTNSGFVTYVYDMTARNFHQNAGSWSGSIHALRIDPSVFSPAGTTAEFDWIRLVDPDSAPELEVCFRVNGSAPNNLVTIWYDSDGSGYNGTPLARYTYANGATSATNCTSAGSSFAHRFNTAIFPPGRYYFYTTLSAKSGSSVVEVSRSGYSAPLTINAAPEAYFTAPTQLTGRDYATAAGNPWDMNSAADIVNLQASFPAVLRQFLNPSFVNGIFQAQADVPLPGNNESDAQVHLNIPAGNPIQTTQYRYLTYRIGADASQYPSISDRIFRGWVTRPVFWSSQVPGSLASFRAHILYEGMQTYTMDLWDTAAIETGPAFQALPIVDTLRIDPLETPIYTWFFLDSVYLTSESTAAQNRYPISFVTDDADNSTQNVSLYYDTDTSGYNGTLIANLGDLTNGSHQYTWNTANIRPGRYYIYLVSRDPLNAKRVYAPVPLIVPANANTERVRYDFDGNYKSDRSIYRPGAFYTQFSNGRSEEQVFGGYGFVATEGDFDGDQRSDETLVANIGGVLYWYILQSSNALMRVQPWGVAGDVVAPADFNGDGLTDIAVYRNGAWFMMYADGGAEVRYWGQAGDWPVPRDYDGDRKDDIAIWRPATGTWWAINSRTQTANVQQWGLFGDYPVPGDYDSDGKEDFAVWRPATGTWFVFRSSDRSPQMYQWGLPGDIPVVGDFIGSGSLDLNVWRSSTGTWYHNDRAGGTVAAQWGLPGDSVGW